MTRKKSNMQIRTHHRSKRNRATMSGRTSHWTVHSKRKKKKVFFMMYNSGNTRPLFIEWTQAPLLRKKTYLCRGESRPSTAKWDRKPLYVKFGKYRFFMVNKLNRFEVVWYGKSVVDELRRKKVSMLLLPYNCQNTLRNVLMLAW